MGDTGQTHVPAVDPQPLIVAAPAAERQLVTAHPSSDAPTPLARGLLLLGDRWTLLVLRRMFMDGDRRYGRLRDALGVADSVLASRLADMAAAGLVERRTVEGHPEYWLAERGLALWPMLVAMVAWERDWSAADAAPLPALIHTTCGAECHPRLGCPDCGDVIRPSELQTRLGPEGRLDLAVPPGLRRRSSKREPHDDGGFQYETLMLVGDRWSVVLFCAILLGARGFTEIQRMVGISPTVLSDRLRRLQEAGVIRREPARGNRAQYAPTPKGVAFISVLTLMVDWSRRWPDARGHGELDGTDVVAFVHATCASMIAPVLLCDRCREPLRRRELRWQAPPG